MPIHQLELKKKGRITTDDQKVVAFLRGHTSLRDALGVDQTVLAAYRRQAEVLFRAEQWQRAIDVIQGLVMLDAIGAVEATMLARAYEALGQTEKATKVGAIISNPLYTQESRIPAAEASE